MVNRSKAVDLVSGPPDVAGGGVYNPANGGDEHGVLVGGPRLDVGDRVVLLPAHCDPTVALHDFWVCHRGGVVETVEPIARGW